MIGDHLEMCPTRAYFEGLLENLTIFEEIENFFEIFEDPSKIRL